MVSPSETPGGRDARVPGSVTRNVPLFLSANRKGWWLVEKTGGLFFHFRSLGRPDLEVLGFAHRAWDLSSSLELTNQIAWLVSPKSCGLQPLEWGLFIRLNWILAFTCACSVHKDLFIWGPESCLLLSTCGMKEWLDWRREGSSPGAGGWRGARGSLCPPPGTASLPPLGMEPPPAPRPVPARPRGDQAAAARSTLGRAPLRSFCAARV